MRRRIALIACALLLLVAVTARTGDMTHPTFPPAVHTGEPCLFGQSGCGGGTPANPYGVLYPVSYDDATTQIASSACPPAGCIVSLSRMIGNDTIGAGPLLSAKTIELWLGGNVTFNVGESASISSITTNCVAGYCLATVTLSTGIDAAWLVANVSVAEVSGTTPTTYIGSQDVVGVSNCSGSPSKCTTFTYNIDAGSDPGAGSGGTVTMAAIQLGGAGSFTGTVRNKGASGSHVYCPGAGSTNGATNAIAPAGLALTGNTCAMVLNPATGLLNGINIGAYVHDVTVEGVSIAGVTQRALDAIVTGVECTFTRIIHNTFAFPIGTYDGVNFTFAGAVPSGWAFHRSGRIQDHSRFSDNSVIGWTNGVFEDGSVGTSGETQGTIIENNTFAYLTGSNAIDCSGCARPIIFGNAVFFSGLLANGSDILIDGISGFRSYAPLIMANLLEGDNILGHAGIVQVKVSGTDQGGAIIDNLLDGNTADSNAAHDPDHNIDIANNSSRITITGNNLGGTSAGGILSVSVNGVCYENNLWGAGHAGTGSEVLPGTSAGGLQCFRTSGPSIGINEASAAPGGTAIFGNSAGNPAVVVGNPLAGAPTNYQLVPDMTGDFVFAVGGGVGETWKAFHTDGHMRFLQGIQNGGNGTLEKALTKYTPTLSPAIVAANTCAEQQFTVAGISTTDVIYSVNKPTAQAGLGIGGYREAALNTLGITFCNTTGAGITPTASEVYSIVAGTF